jgi:tetratricopeptide (TPR) repeat protein
VALAVIAAAGGGALFWWWPHEEAIPPVPPVPPALADPEVINAIEAARARVRREPRSADAWGFLGMVLAANDVHEEGLICLEQAERLAPRDPRWPYRRGATLSSLDPPAAILLLRSAVDLCRAAGVDDTAPQLHLAGVLVALGQQDQAEEIFRRVRDQHPDDLQARFGLGLLAAQRGDLENARSLLLGCLESPCARQKACAELTAICRRLNDAAAAERFSRQTRELPRDQAWPSPYMDELYGLIVGREARRRQVERLKAEGRVAEAVEVLRRVAAEEPGYSTFIELAGLLAQKRDLAGAEAALRSALRLDPEKVQAHYLLTVCLVEQAQQASPGLDQEKVSNLLREAEEHARRATEIKPDHARAHRYLGQILERRGQRREALAELRKAVHCEEDSVDAHLRLGELLAEDGQLAEARQHLEKALELASPGDTRPQEALARLRTRP